MIIISVLRFPLSTGLECPSVRKLGSDGNLIILQPVTADLPLGNFSLLVNWKVFVLGFHATLHFVTFLSIPEYFLAQQFVWSLILISGFSRGEGEGRNQLRVCQLTLYSVFTYSPICSFHFIWLRINDGSVHPPPPMPDRRCDLETSWQFCETYVRRLLNFCETFLVFLY